MQHLGRLAALFPLIAALALASCGGADLASRTESSSGQDVKVGEKPAPSPVPDSAAFIKLARASDCAGTRNRLFVIDQKMVFWDRADLRCADASYSQQLFGATPQEVLCTAGDSIAGPMTSCAKNYADMFATILKNLNDPDLGLAGVNKVQALAFLPKEGSAISFESVVDDAMSGVQSPKNVVIRDLAAWETLWAEHGAKRVPAPPLPKVDFSKSMLLGVFLGEGAGGCRQVGVAKVSVRADKISVDYEERDIGLATICIAVMSSPMNVVAVERSDAQVEFVNIKPVQLAFQSIDQTTRSNIDTARSVVVKDAVSWSALWIEHAGNTSPVPPVDFTRHMVAAVFSGSKPNGCHSTDIMGVYRDGNKLTVARVDWVPGEGVFCTLAIVTPAHLVKVERSDDPVEFTSQVHTIVPMK